MEKSILSLKSMTEVKEVGALKIWGKILKNNKIMKDKVVVMGDAQNYQENLKKCMLKICKDFDIEKPYWLPSNVDEYNSRRKTSFTSDNFIDSIDFDKFTIEEIHNKK